MIDAQCFVACDSVDAMPTFGGYCVHFGVVTMSTMGTIAGGRFLLQLEAAADFVVAVVVVLVGVGASSATTE